MDLERAGDSQRPVEDRAQRTGRERTRPFSTDDANLFCGVVFTVLLQEATSFINLLLLRLFVLQLNTFV